MSTSGEQNSAGLLENQNPLHQAGQPFHEGIFPKSKLNLPWHSIFPPRKLPWLGEHLSPVLWKWRILQNWVKAIPGFRGDEKSLLALKIEMSNWWEQSGSLEYSSKSSERHFQGKEQKEIPGIVNLLWDFEAWLECHLWGRGVCVRNTNRALQRSLKSQFGV